MKKTQITIEHGGKSVTVTDEQLAAAASGTIALTGNEHSKRLVTKIKITAKDASLIRYDRVNESTQETENCELPFFGAIHPDFEDALNALLPIVVEVAGLDEAAWADGQVTGVSLKHEGDGIGVTITCQRGIDGGKMVCVVNTPYLNPEYMSGDDRFIQNVIREALLCVDGKRLHTQMSLFQQEG